MPARSGCASMATVTFVGAAMLIALLALIVIVASEVLPPA